MALSDSQTGTIIFHGESPASVIVEGEITKGDPVGYSGGWKRARAASGSLVQTRAIAGEDGVDGQTITVYFGVVVMGGRFSGCTVGGAVYNSETDGGLYTQTAPVASGASNKVIGWAISTDRIAAHPNQNVDTVA